jgi:hypothetical protein
MGSIFNVEITGELLGQLLLHCMMLHRQVVVWTEIAPPALQFHPTSQCHRLLQRCGPAAMGSIFRVEMTGELLGQLLLVLQEQWQQQQQQQQQDMKQQQQQDMQQQQQAEQQQSVHDLDGNSTSAAAAAMWQEALFVVQLLHSLTGEQSAVCAPSLL